MMNPLKKLAKVIYYLIYSFYYTFHSIYTDLRDWNVDKDIAELKEFMQLNNDIYTLKKEARKKQ